MCERVSEGSHPRNVDVGAENKNLFIIFVKYGIFFCIIFDLNLLYTRLKYRFLKKSVPQHNETWMNRDYLSSLPVKTIFQC